MIEATLAEWRRTRFEWGRTDCIMSVCDYIAAVTGKDPAAAWRGTYSDEAGAHALAEAHGGVLGIFRHGAGMFGLKPLQGPLRGAVAVCDIAGKEVAGLCLGERTAFRTLRGVIELRAPILGAWAV